MRDLTAAEPFYQLVLPALGFPRREIEPDCICYLANDDSPRPRFVALNEDPEYVANSTRVAFWADSRQAVDDFAAVLIQTPARAVEGPMVCEEYSPGYYAIFFEDPCGNRFEVCHRIPPSA